MYIKHKKILFLLIISIFILAQKKKEFNVDENIINTLNDANEAKIDFMCYNMCKETTKGMNIIQIEKFCRKQCPLK